MDFDKKNRGLIAACRNNNFENVEKLIAYRADVNARDNDGRMAFETFEAAGENLHDWYSIKYVIKLGDDCADSDKDRAIKFYKLASNGELNTDDEKVYSLKTKAIRKIAEIYEEAEDYETAVEWYKKFAEDTSGDILLYNTDKYYAISKDSVFLPC